VYCQSSTDVVVEDLTVINEHDGSSLHIFPDGVAVDESENVIIRNCRVEVTGKLTTCTGIDIDGSTGHSSVTIDRCEIYAMHEAPGDGTAFGIRSNNESELEVFDTSIYVDQYLTSARSATCIYQRSADTTDDVVKVYRCQLIPWSASGLEHFFLRLGSIGRAYFYASEVSGTSNTPIGSDLWMVYCHTETATYP